MNGLIIPLLQAIPAKVPGTGLPEFFALLKEHLDSIQLLHFFFISYLLSRLIAKYHIAERFINWLFEEKKINMSKLVLILISGTAALSMLLANVVTLLALLPMIVLVQSEVQGSPKERKRLSTMIMLAAIWGANIGGMGMLTGTPSNGVLVGMLGAYGFKISRQFTFISWMVWAIPLVAILCVSGWLILILIFKPRDIFSGHKLRKILSDAAVPLTTQRIILWLALFFLITTALLSFLLSTLWEQRVLIYWITVLWTLILLWLMFGIRWQLAGVDKRKPLLIYQDITKDLPRKGLLWILIGFAVTAGLYLLGVPKTVAVAVAEWVQSNYSLLLLMLIFGLAATFFTEVASNLVVQIALFTTLVPLSKTFPDLSWQMFLIITLTSCCAFMSPIATPVNGLGFGASKRFSLAYMLGAGFIMNIVSALIIAGWVHYVVPVVLNWFA
jgi:solute carrier family 13 (sodium-dependent dicarboxylate transporter), member 2/3/5